MSDKERLTPSQFADTLYIVRLALAEHPDVFDGWRNNITRSVLDAISRDAPHIDLHEAVRFGVEDHLRKLIGNLG